MTSVAEVRVGLLLRFWRERRRLSQLDLALAADISPRHLSFVETGRSRPSAEMVQHLAECLEVPLRERNALLLAAGYAPAHHERDLNAPEMAPVHQAIERLPARPEPSPGMVVDRAGRVVAANPRPGPPPGVRPPGRESACPRSRRRETRSLRASPSAGARESAQRRSAGP